MPLEKGKVEIVTSIVKSKSTDGMIQSWQTLRLRSELAINRVHTAGVVQAVESVV